MGNVISEQREGDKLEGNLSPPYKAPLQCLYLRQNQWASNWTELDEHEWKLSLCLLTAGLQVTSLQLTWLFFTGQLKAVLGYMSILRLWALVTWWSCGKHPSLKVKPTHTHTHLFKCDYLEGIIHFSVIKLKWTKGIQWKFPLIPVFTYQFPSLEATSSWDPWATL